uniref:hypothetical protein n=1 Tax=Mycobacteriaceae TaxID=1762 RepID=UPI000B0CCFA0
MAVADGFLDISDEGRESVVCRLFIAGQTAEQITLATAAVLRQIRCGGLDAPTAASASTIGRFKACHCRAQSVPTTSKMAEMAEMAGV